MQAPPEPEVAEGHGLRRRRWYRGRRCGSSRKVPDRLCAFMLMIVCIPRFVMQLADEMLPKAGRQRL